MVNISKSLINERYTGNEFKNSSVLNDGVSLEQIKVKLSKKLRKNKARRMRQQKKY